MGKSVSQGKSFDISKWEVWEAYRRVKAIPGQGQLAMEENPSPGLVFHQGCSGADQDGVGVRDQG